MTIKPGNAENRDSAQRIASMSPAQLELLAQRLKEKYEHEPGVSLIHRSERNFPFPLSFAQERLWFIEQLNPDRSLFNLSGSLALKGMVNVEALEQTFRELVRRHEIFRTSFPVDSGQPIQAIAPPPTQFFPLVDLSGLSGPERETLIKRLVLQEERRPFDLMKDGPLRIKLLWLDKEELILLQTLHHIAFDLWSWNIMSREMVTLYMQFSHGEPSSLSDLSIQYADFAIWQRQHLQGDVLDRLLAYWNEQLRDRPPALTIPTDHPRQAAAAYVGARHNFAVPRRLTEAVRSLAHQEGATVFMTLLAAFYLLLSRYTGQTDISFGTLVANRNRTEIEGLIGFFLNTLVLRVSFGRALTVCDLIEQVRQVTLGAYAHQDLPFELLLNKLPSNTGPEAPPLFQVMFGVTAPASKGSSIMRLPGIRIAKMPGFERSGDMVRGWSRSDLVLEMEEKAHELTSFLGYNTLLFEPVTLSRMIQQFLVLLDGMTADPHRPLWALPILPETERHQLLVEWNDSQSDSSFKQCYQHLFDIQVERSPDAIAAIFQHEQLTYRKLHQEAGRLAHQLALQGLPPEGLVALLPIRNIDFLIAVLAVFKANGAYIPLDPADPPRRLGHVLRQSKTDTVLVAGELMPDCLSVLEGLATEARPKLLPLEDLRCEEPPAANLPDHAVANNLSYVIYTSGSTGEPKGAMIEQAGMVNHLFAKIHDLRMSEKDIVAQTASQCFDISVWQFLAVLLVGGRVCVVDNDAARDPARLTDLVERETVTILEVVPSLLRMMMEGALSSRTTGPGLSSLRWLLVTGEELSPELSRHWSSGYSHIPLLNAYGPTECSDDVTHAVICRPPEMETIRMPIGRPVSNMRMYILDATGSFVPVGVDGELYVGGVGLGRGYLNDPKRTAEVYLPDGFSGQSGARLYKTGDLVRYQADGNIEFLGRIDHQVKIRGFRIELAEIEMALSQHPAVRQAIVLAREDPPRGKRLVAYIVSNQDSSPPLDEIREALQERLPDYMVPTSFLALDALPLTPNGKLNRSALPSPDEAQTESVDTFIPHGTPLEERLTEIWTEILKVQRIGIYDNFFRLGGHSLMAIQVINRINQSFQVNLSVRDIFEEPTIAGLAVTIEESILDRLEAEERL